MGLKFPKFSIARLLGAITLVSLGFGVLAVNVGSAADFVAQLTIIGAFFGGAVGLIVGRPKLLTLIGAGLFLLFALRATLA